MLLARAVPLVVLIVLVPAAAGEDSGGFAPLGVAAASAGAEVVVSWLPGAQPADSYRVYGLSEGGAVVLLLDTAETANPGVLAATVEAGWSSYAVSGVWSGAESRLVYSLSSVDLLCVTVEFHPPSVSRRCLKVAPALAVSGAPLAT